MPTQEYRYLLDEDAELVVELCTEKGKPTRYSVVLLALDGGVWRTVRVFDNDHDVPHMHRYTRAGEKGDAEKIVEPTASDGYNMALERVKDGFRGMIDGWR